MFLADVARYIFSYFSFIIIIIINAYCLCKNRDIIVKNKNILQSFILSIPIIIADVHGPACSLHNSSCLILHPRSDDVGGVLEIADILLSGLFYYHCASCGMQQLIGLYVLVQVVVFLFLGFLFVLYVDADGWQIRCIFIHLCVFVQILVIFQFVVVGLLDDNLPTFHKINILPFVILIFDNNNALFGHQCLVVWLLVIVVIYILVLILQFVSDVLLFHLLIFDYNNCSLCCQLFIGQLLVLVIVDVVLASDYDYLLGDLELAEICQLIVILIIVNDIGVVSFKHLFFEILDENLLLLLIFDDNDIAMC